MTTLTPYPASEKQIAFLRRLTSERDTTGVTEMLEEARRSAVEGTFDKRSASALIDALLDCPKAKDADVTPDAEPEAGIYENGGTLYRVYKGQQSGRMLVSRIDYDTALVTGGEESDGEPVPSVENVSYDYLGLAARNLPATATRLSLEQVGGLGKAFDHCLICGRRLDDPDSVDLGIGPVCASRYDA